MTSPFLYFADDRLSRAELTAARLDGDVVEVGEAFMPADAVETRALRAGSLLPLVGDDLAATHGSAAWIHGGLDDPPVRHSVQRRSERRISPVLDLRLRYRDGRMPRGDVVVISGVAVTTVARTLGDLLRSDLGAGLPPGPEARGLLRAHPTAALDTLAHLAAAGPLVFKRPVIAWLRDHLGQDEVTRYTS